QNDEVGCSSKTTPELQTRSVSRSKVTPTGFASNLVTKVVREREGINRVIPTARSFDRSSVAVLLRNLVTPEKSETVKENVSFKLQRSGIRPIAIASAVSANRRTRVVHEDKIPQQITKTLLNLNTLITGANRVNTLSPVLRSLNSRRILCKRPTLKVGRVRLPPILLNHTDANAQSFRGRSSKHGGRRSNTNTNLELVRTRLVRKSAESITRNKLNRNTQHEVNRVVTRTHSRSVSGRLLRVRAKSVPAVLVHKVQVIAVERADNGLRVRVFQRHSINQAERRVVIGIRRRSRRVSRESLDKDINTPQETSRRNLKDRKILSTRSLSN